MPYPVENSGIGARYREIQEFTRQLPPPSEVPVNENDFFPRYQPLKLHGGAGEIAAKGHWEDGLWTVEFRRALITPVGIMHIPMILERKGRNALIGVVLTHTGILILIVGVIYGGMSGFRYEVKAIEGEMTIVPGLPFVIHLDKLVVEDYPPNSMTHLDPEILPKKRQESRLSFYKRGELWRKAIAAPGHQQKSMT